MPRTCTVCTHANRDEIDRALLAGKAFRHIAERFGLSPAALVRHKGGHLPATLAKAHDAGEVVRADTLLDQVRNLLTRTLGILDRAEQAGDGRTALAAVREARSTLDFLAVVTGELAPRPVPSSPVTLNLANCIGLGKAPGVATMSLRLLEGGRVVPVFPDMPDGSEEG